jgi:hypothetical protein
VSPSHTLDQGEKKGKACGEEEGALTKHGAHVNVQLRATEQAVCTYIQKSISIREKRQVNAGVTSSLGGRLALRI